MAAVDESKYESLLNELPSSERYKKLSSINNPGQYESYCNRSSMQGTDKKHLKALCAKSVGNLKNLRNLENLEKTHDDRCTFYTFWVYKELSKIFKGSSSKIDYQFFNELDDILLRVNLNELNKVYCDFKIEPDLNNWNEKRMLHDFFKNSETIYQCIISEISGCREKYCNYVVDVKRLYDKYKPLCLWEEVCDYFDFNKKNPYEILAKLKCIGYENVEVPVDEGIDTFYSTPKRPTVRTGTFRLLGTSRTGDETVSSYKNYKCNYTLSDDGEITNLSGCIEVPSNDEDLEESSRFPVLDENDYSDYAHNFAGDIDTIKDYESPLEVKKGFLSWLMHLKSSKYVFILGSLFLVMLIGYKLINLKGSVTKRKTKKSKTNNKIYDEYDNTFSEYNPYNMNMDYYDDGYNMQYYSAWDY
ncbi:variable surface protein [Plasmodium gonderi]|uniref:Variable surface protein n=1 Tax=Plasmodium gonderi TaxID=77519 RepID=A0A1Y1JBI6_PLAGO|nr:variable surface protein [Plasmodium gonderi]GAW79038.1 variable surface protein [Plasmodium gonderi]